MDKKKSTTEKVLYSITQKKLCPRPRWHFVLRNGAFWVSGFLFLCVSAIAVSVIIFIVINGEWGLRRALGRDVFEHILVSIPFLWTILFVLFAFAVEYNMRHTKSGYRHPVRIVVACTIGISILAGVVLYNIGVSHLIDEMLEHALPRYESFEHKRNASLHKPGEGRISGIIMGKNDEQILLMRSMSDQKWIVDVSRVPGRQRTQVSVGTHVVIFGLEVSEKTSFVACALKTLPQKGFRKRKADHSREDRELLFAESEQKKRMRQPMHGDNLLEEKIQQSPPCMRLQKQGL